MHKVLTTPTFDKVVKKLHATDKKELDKAVKAVATDPAIGEPKKGDLAGVSVYKFKMNQQEMLLAYRASQSVVTLLALGAHENFYRDMKT